MIIYQIGNYRVNLAPSSLQDLTYSVPIGFRQEATELTEVGGAVFYNRPGRPLAKLGNWKAQGTLLCANTEDCTSVRQQFNNLVANSGTVLPIIAVIPAEECRGRVCDCDSKLEAQWLVTWGVVTDLKNDFSWKMQESYPLDSMEIELTIKSYPYWEPLNDISWKYWGRNKPTLPDITSEVEKQLHPFQPNWQGRADSGFQYRTGMDSVGGYYFLGPANWIRAYSIVRDRRQRAVMIDDDPANYYVTVTSAADYSYTVEAPVSDWPAPPRSLFYFNFSEHEGLPDSGSMTLTVETLTPSGIVIENTATLSFADYDDLFPLFTPSAFYTGWMENFYINADVVLNGKWVPWSYTGLYPGEIPMGLSTVTLSLSSGLSVDFSYLHVFRSY